MPGLRPRSGRLGKGVVDWRSVIPGGYWVQRYRSALLHRIVMLDGFCLFAAWLIHGAIPRGSLLTYLLLRVAHVCVSELGYFMNDLWSEPRETPGSPPPVAPAPVLTLAVAARVGTVAAMLQLVLLVSPTGFPAVAGAGVLALVAATFVAHNLVAFPYRVASYGLLYALRFLLFAVAVGSVLDGTEQGIFLCFAAVPVGAFMWKYWADRDPGARARFAFGLVNRSQVNAILRVEVAALILASGVAAVAFGVAGLRVGGGLLLFLLVVDGLLVVGRFLSKALLALRPTGVLRHVHTHYSHDASSSPSDVHGLAGAAGLKQVFLADHAEDFDEGTYAELKERCVTESSSVELVPGLEYDVCGQHFLCFGLAEFLPISGQDVHDLEALRAASDRLVWAHPHFKIRRLFGDGQYRGMLLRMLRAVDGVEIINFKGLRGWHHAWRHLFVGLVACVLGSQDFVVGLDAHHPEDFRGVASDYPMGRLGRQRWN